VTRAASFHTAEIAPDEHAAWLGRQLGSASTQLLVGEIDDVPSGQVRLSTVEPGVVEVGISVASERRGQGVGAALLEAAIQHARSGRGAERIGTVIARVRTENEASRRLFERAGFVLHAEGECDGQPCRTYELTL
jgi:RimJ/RimL family protein N-acetyltransferase